MADNVAQPGNTVVPSARPERRRTFLDDLSGTSLYAVVVGLVVVAVLLVTFLA